MEICFIFAFIGLILESFHSLYIFLRGNHV